MKKLLLFSFTVFFLSFLNLSCDDSSNNDSPTPAYEARAEFLRGKGDNKNIGILVVHGFTGSTQSMRPIAYGLRDKGYTISMPRLKGHGTTPEDMETTGYMDWVNSVKEAYDYLNTQVDKVYVLGLSMGGTQTLYAAINYNIAGAITINASVQTDPNFVPNYDGLPRFMDGIGSDIMKEGVTEWAYSKTPLACRKEMDIFKKVVGADLGKITCPILIFKSLHDNVVKPITIQNFIFDNVGTPSADKKLVDLENSAHVATLDNDQGKIIEDSHEFIQSLQ